MSSTYNPCLSKISMSRSWPEGSTLISTQLPFMLTWAWKKVHLAQQDVVAGIAMTK